MEPLTGHLAKLPDRPANRWTRRSALRAVSLGAGALTHDWLRPLAHVLAEEPDGKARFRPARSVILLWLGGGPSQLETFDPHPQSPISAGTKAIDTAVKGVQIAAGLPQVAEQMESIALVRSLVSKEGDHQRGHYLAHTGHSPAPNADFPSFGAICCRELPIDDVAIPRHVSILSSPWPSTGGFLGPEYDAFQTFDPANPVPDVTPRVDGNRYERRLASLDVLEHGFATSDARRAAQAAHRETMSAARKMMTSEELEALDVSLESREVRDEYGDTPFGRGCLAARRLVAVGVRCVEVTLSGWDTHTDNHEGHERLNRTLDPALAALVRDLGRHELLEETIVLCLGEFGRTPKLNALSGRDHWTYGFSAALAGGGIRGGQVHGATDPDGGRRVESPVSFADLHATLLTALGIDPRRELVTPAERPVKLSEGTPIAALLVDRA